MKAKEETRSIRVKITELDFRKLKSMAKKRGVSYRNLAVSIVRKEIYK